MSRLVPQLLRSASTIFLLTVICIAAKAAVPTQQAVTRGRQFLVSLLNTNLDLLPEYRGAHVYWLFHDNYLAAKVLSRTHPDTARTVTAAMEREGIKRSGKIEIIFGEAEKPLPFRQYQLQDVRHIGNNVIRTEVVTDKVLKGWEQYADLLLLACMAENDRAVARQRWDAAMRLWDGRGFADAATKHAKRYATYKLAFALLAGGRLSPPVSAPDGLIERLLSLQDKSGGWITDYDSDGKKIGLANVETTCLAILGLEPK